MFFPLAWAFKDGTHDIKAFIASMAIGLLLAGFLFAVGRGANPKDMGAREAFAAVALAWVLASFVGSMPYLLSGAAPSFTDAYFEAMSGFTTTGATILTDIEINPRGILMWRAQTQWLGGMGIVVLTIALLPMLGVSMTQLFKAESPGPVLEKISPRIHVMAAILWKVYMALTVIGVTLLMCGGMNIFESICHTFAAVATGGFSPKNASVAAYNSPWHEWVLMGLMFFSGANFTLHVLSIRNKTFSPYRDTEFRLYTGIVCSFVAAITVFIYTKGLYPDVMTSLRHAAFQVISTLTTTGFVTADFELWPPFTQGLLVVSMLIGGCAGSTSGGIKCVRIQVVFKQIYAELRRFIRPQAAIPVRLGNYTVESEQVFSATTYICLYMMVIIISSLAVMATGEDVLTSLTGVITTMGNVGPGLGNVGPVENFASQHCFSKWVYSFCMLAGRLELYTVLVLFTKDAWKR